MKNYSFDSVIFDLDGVITKTALVHAHAWKEIFDEFLRKKARQDETSLVEFSYEKDYLTYVDGKPRYKGVESFLQSRNINLPFGSPEDPPEMETVCGLGNRKNIAFNAVLEREGVEVYPSTLALMEELKKAGIPMGVASSSKNCKKVLERIGLLKHFKTRVDGEVSAELGLKGKPEPDIFTVACDNLGVSYARSVVVEDAVSGVQAGRKGNFGLVIGIARENNSEELKMNGADIVVSDLEEIQGIDGIETWFREGLFQDSWSVSYHDYTQEKERSREALLTVGNGYFATRGSMEESEASKSHYPGTYMAGLYNRLTSPVGNREIENEDFVNAIDWLPFSFKVGEGEWFSPGKDQILQISRRLDFSTGMLSKRMIVKDIGGNESLIESKRIVSMDCRHHAAIEYSITALNYSGHVRVKSGMQIPEKNDGVDRYKELNQRHLEPLSEGGSNHLSYVSARTVQSGITIAAAASMQSFYEEKPLATDFVIKQEKGQVNTYIKNFVQKGQTFRIQKLLSVCNSLTKDISDPLDFVLKDIRQIHSFEEMLEKSRLAWEKLWKKADIQIAGDRLSQKLLRLHIYHSLVTTSPHHVTIDFGIPARGLHGEAYRGHIFWDELYILPFYCIHFPDIAKSVLMYRYRRLDKAREYARQHGYSGAMYPWQSGSSGREETQVVHLNPVSGKWGDDYSSLQRHISIAVACNVWNYFQITGDLEFMENFGAEIYLEICRFWSSKATYDTNTGKYDIDKVMGPDEFHEKMPGSSHGGLKNNAYTNVMVSWLLKEAFSLLEQMSEEAREQLIKSIQLTQDELDDWTEKRTKLSLSVSPEGIIEQFDGYFGLKELDWEHYRQTYKNIYRLDRILKAEGKSPDKYKLAKQADTMMTFYNLDISTVNEVVEDMGYQLPSGYLDKNFQYYITRCSHGSSLSRVVYAYLAAMLGKKPLDWELYTIALKSDFDDIQGGTTAEGIHMGVMIGSVMMALTAFAGLKLQGNILEITPHLPEHWVEMKFKCSFKGVDFQLELSKHSVTILADSNTQILISGRTHQLTAKKPFSIRIA